MIHERNLKKSNHRKTPTQKIQKGFVLVLVMVLTLIMAIIAFAVLGFGLWSYQQATFYEDYQQALYSAEAGINYSISRHTTSTWQSVSSPSTGSISNASFNVTWTSTTITGVVQLISTATVTRLTSRYRSVSVNAMDLNPWLHFIWQGCDGAPSGSDKTGYPSPYNSTSNGPEYNTGQIGFLSFYSPAWQYGGKKWLPYWSYITSTIVQNAFYMGRDTTIINITRTAAGVTFQFRTTGNFGIASGSLPGWVQASTGLIISVTNPSTYNIYGTYTGLLYIQGTMNIDNPLTIYGQMYVVGGNININKTDVAVAQITTQSPASALVSPTDRTGTTYREYVTIACIDTTASQYCDSTSDSRQGNINQATGNSTLKMGQISAPVYPGGVMYCSNYYSKNGQGTEINGVIMTMNNDINGFPSGGYYFDPNPSQQPEILGVDVSAISGKRVVAGSWQELPAGWAL